MKLNSRLIFISTGVIGIGFGVWQAIQLRWLCDDAFISFVYARNLADGIGLVYQSGEYVEGYSNFLWTILLSVFVYLKIPLLLSSQILGIIFYLCLLFYLFTKESKLRPFAPLPLYLLHLCFFYHGWIFSTSGLETMMFTFFITTGLIEWEKNIYRGGYLFLLASLTRPEGILFLGLWTISKYADWRRIRFYFPMVFFLLFELFRIYYYGDILPNTFYAKADHPQYFAQGWNYFLYWIMVYPVYLPVLMVAVWLQFKNLFKEKRNLFLSCSVIFYLIFVIYVGGDFMAMRFWIPAIPFLSWTAFLSLTDKMDELQIDSSLVSRMNRLIKANSIYIQFLFLISLAVYVNPFSGVHATSSTWKGVGEERRFYENHLSQTEGYDVNALADFRVAFFGAQAHYIFWMKPSYALEAETGLTDRNLARKKIEERGRVGHEKLSSLAELKERRIELVLDNRYPELNLPYIIHRWRGFDWKIFIFIYDPKKINLLCKRELWNCSAFFEEIKVRNLDRRKGIKFVE